ncbi:MAG: hypothetical protein R3B06_31585 [Kofleriaceae bacterium]
MTPFGRILERAIAGTPGAVGGAFAAPDGEMVDFVAKGDATEWALLTAHYGVVLANLESLLDTQHFGGTEYFIIENQRLAIVVHAVDGGYYVLLAVPPPAPLSRAIAAVRAAAAALRQEML